MDPLRIALAGVGGYGEAHVAAAADLANAGLGRVVAFADPAVPSTSRVLLAEGARGYRDFGAMLRAEHDLDLVCIAAPPQHHVAMAHAAFTHGLHVFVEKPPALRIQDLRWLIEAERTHDVQCAVGFHDVARPHVVALKRRICEGAIGELRRIRACAAWQRSERYFRRNDWAGLSHKNATLILDGPLMNACAHVLNLAAFIAGPEPHLFAQPVRAQAELYRANPDNTGEDTSCLRVVFDNGVEFVGHLTLCAENPRPRWWTFEGDSGAARLEDQEPVRINDETLDWEEPEPPTTTLIRRLTEVAQGLDDPLLMPLAEAEPWMLMANGAYESARRIVAIPREHLDVRGDDTFTLVLVPGIAETMARAAAEGLLLSEAGVPWARPTDPFDLAGYDTFPSRWSAR